MLSRIISVLFATIAGAAALIGLTRGRNTTIGSNRITTDQVSPQQPEPLSARQIGQNTVNVTPSSAGDDTVEADFTVTTETGNTTTDASIDTSVASSDAAIADDPTPGASPSAPAAATETTTQSTPSPAATPTIASPASATSPTAAPASAPAQPRPVRAMW